MVDTETGEFTEKTLSHEGNEVESFTLPSEGRVIPSGGLHFRDELYLDATLLEL